MDGVWLETVVVLVEFDMFEMDVAAVAKTGYANISAIAAMMTALPIAFVLTFIFRRLLIWGCGVYSGTEGSVWTQGPEALNNSKRNCRTP